VFVVGTHDWEAKSIVSRPVPQGESSIMGAEHARVLQFAPSRT